MSYIPTKDADLLAWGQNFADVIAAEPVAYGLLPADAVVISTNMTEFANAYAEATNPATRTIVTIAAKDEEKAGFLSLARAYAALIRANAGVSDADKAAAGLTIPDPTPTPIPVPSTTPVMSAPFQGQGTVLLSVTDSANPPTTKAKPFGVVGGCLFSAKWTGATPPVASTKTLVGIFTKSDNVIDNASLGVEGEKIRLYSQWFNRKGQLGPIGATIDIILLS